VQATFVIPIAILTEAFLSYLGWASRARSPPGIDRLRGYTALPLEPFMMLWPAIALSITLLAFNFLGDGLRDAFDPASVVTDSILEVRKPQHALLHRRRRGQGRPGSELQRRPGGDPRDRGRVRLGKSVTAMSVLGLVQATGQGVGGEIMFKGSDLLKLSKEELRNIRGRDIAMIFQDRSAR